MIHRRMMFELFTFMFLQLILKRLHFMSTEAFELTFSCHTIMPSKVLNRRTDSVYIYRYEILRLHDKVTSDINNPMYHFRSTERWLYICSVSEWRSPTMDVTRLCRTLPSSNILWNCDPPTCQKMAQLASVFNKISFA